MDTFTAITQAFPQYAKYLILLPIITRILYALKNNGGIKGAWEAVMYGTNQKPPVK